MALSEHPLPPDLALDVVPFDDDALDEYLAAGDTAEDLAPTVAAWRIDDDGAAEWAMRNLVARRRRIDDLARRRDEWMEKIAHWFEQASAGDSRSAAFFEGALADYLRRLREEDEDRKSLVLPSGRITSTGTGGKATVVDVDAVVAWIQKNLPERYDALVKDEPTVRLADFRKATKIVERANEVVVLVLDCEHRVDAGENPGAETVDCVECGPDPIDETLPTRKVVAVETRLDVERVVISADLGYPIPGVEIEPAGFSVSVKPDLS